MSENADPVAEPSYVIGLHGTPGFSPTHEFAEYLSGRFNGVAHIEPITEKLMKDVAGMLGKELNEIKENKNHYRPFLRWYGWEHLQEHLGGNLLDQYKQRKKGR